MKTNLLVSAFIMGVLLTGGAIAYVSEFWDDVVVYNATDFTNISTTGITMTGNITTGAVYSDYYLNSTGDKEWITGENVYDIDLEDICGVDTCPFVEVTGGTFTGDVNVTGMLNVTESVFINDRRVEAGPNIGHRNCTDNYCITFILT